MEYKSNIMRPFIVRPINNIENQETDCQAYTNIKDVELSIDEG